MVRHTTACANLRNGQNSYDNNPWLFLSNLVHELKNGQAFALGESRLAADGIEGLQREEYGLSPWAVQD